MKPHLISLCFVRMAVRQSRYKDVLHFAVSSKYAPALNHDGTLLHGNYTILSTSNKWAS